VETVCVVCTGSYHPFRALFLPSPLLSLAPERFANDDVSNPISAPSTARRRLPYRCSKGNRTEVVYHYPFMEPRWRPVVDNGNQFCRTRDESAMIRCIACAVTCESITPWHNLTLIQPRLNLNSESKTNCKKANLLSHIINCKASFDATKYITLIFFKKVLFAN